MSWCQITLRSCEVHAGRLLSTVALSAERVSKMPLSSTLSTFLMPNLTENPRSSFFSFPLTFLVSLRAISKDPFILPFCHLCLALWSGSVGRKACSALLHLWHKISTGHRSLSLHTENARMGKGYRLAGVWNKISHSDLGIYWFWVWYGYWLCDNDLQTRFNSLICFQTRQIWQASTLHKAYWIKIKYAD